MAFCGVCLRVPSAGKDRRAPDRRLERPDRHAADAGRPSVRNRGGVVIKTLEGRDRQVGVLVSALALISLVAK
jgi:hypothetical protein